MKKDRNNINKSSNEGDAVKNLASEPEVPYKKWTLKKFDTFEEMENNQLSYFASLTPEELLKNHKHLSMAAFGIKNEQNLNKPDRKIKFDYL